MKAVDQRRIDSVAGDCFAACVASLLELDLDTVPNFVAAKGNWIDIANDWAATRNFQFVWWSASHGCIPAGNHILVGKSPRGDYSHAIVVNGPGYAEDIVHDPHPSRAGVEKWQFRYVLTPLDRVRVSGEGSNAGLPGQGEPR